MAFLVILAVLVFIVLVLVSRIRIVPQANVYVVERLGAFYKAWGTGIHFLVPLGYQGHPCRTEKHPAAG